MTPLWLALQTTATREDIAHETLTSSGIEALWLHRSREISKVRRGVVKTYTRHESLLPGYVIAAHTGDPSFYRTINAMQWPSGRKMFTSVLAQPIPEHRLEHLVAMSGMRIALPDAPRFAVGQRVKYLPTGHDLTITSVEGRLKAMLYGREVVVRPEHLEAA